MPTRVHFTPREQWKFELLSRALDNYLADAQAEADFEDAFTTFRFTDRARDLDAFIVLSPLDPEGDSVLVAELERICSAFCEARHGPAVARYHGQGDPQ